MTKTKINAGFSSFAFFSQTLQRFSDILLRFSDILHYHVISRLQLLETLLKDNIKVRFISFISADYKIMDATNRKRGQMGALCVHTVRNHLLRHRLQAQWGQTVRMQTGRTQTVRMQTYRTCYSTTYKCLLN